MLVTRCKQKQFNFHFRVNPYVTILIISITHIGELETYRLFFIAYKY